MDQNAAPLSRTGLAWDEWFMWHNTGMAGGLVPGGGFVEPYLYVENAEAKRRSKNLLDRAGVTERLVPIKSRPATESELCYFHSAEYVARVREGSKLPHAMAGPFAPIGPDTFDIASRAVGAMIEAVDHVIDGKLDNAYAFLRPPGHHAQRDQGLGLCIFGNIAIAAHHARHKRGLARVAVVDYDAHRGNGAEEGFYSDPSVLTISLHQRGWYGDDGDFSARGDGEGVGYNINVPLPSGSSDGAYSAAFERIVIPALRRFKPDLILVAAGYDISEWDMLSTMMVSSAGFRSMARQLVDAAAELCDGRIVFEHEGGYNPWSLPFSVLATIEEISGIQTGIPDPFDTFREGSADRLLLPHQDEIIGQVQRAFEL